MRSAKERKANYFRSINPSAKYRRLHPDVVKFSSPEVQAQFLFNNGIIPSPTAFRSTIRMSPKRIHQ